MAYDLIQSEIDQVRSFLKGREAPPGAMNIPERRAGMDAFGDALPLPDGCVSAPAVWGGVGGETLTPANAVAGAHLLYLHGGGYVLGSARSHRALVAQLALAANVTATVLDYRLAPEHPAPGAVEDAVAAFEALTASGLDPRRIVAAGDSAGGGLALAMTLALKQRGHALPGGLFCISPWADLSQTGASYAHNSIDDPMVGKESLDAFAVHYLAGMAADNPIVSPVHGDFSGFPPLLIHVGTQEVLLSDALAVAEKAALAHVEATLVAAPGMVHVFHAFFPMLTPARTAIAHAGRWIAARVA